jgi:hypothetical protein
MTPGYPNLMEESQYCHWTLTGPAETSIQLYFQALDINEDCFNNYVSIFDLNINYNNPGNGRKNVFSLKINKIN